MLIKCRFYKIAAIFQKETCSCISNWNLFVAWLLFKKSKWFPLCTWLIPKHNWLVILNLFKSQLRTTSYDALPSILWTSMDMTTQWFSCDVFSLQCSSRDIPMNLCATTRSTWSTPSATTYITTSNAPRGWFTCACEPRPPISSRCWSERSPTPRRTRPVRRPFRELLSFWFFTLAFVF